MDNDPVGARPQGFGHQALSSKPQEPAASPSAVSSTAGKLGIFSLGCNAGRRPAVLSFQFLVFSFKFEDSVFSF